MSARALEFNKGQLLKSLWRHLSSRRRRQFWLLLLLTVLAAFAEVVSLGAILPFIGLLTTPEAAFDSPVVAPIVELLGIATPRELLVPMTLLFIAAAVVAGLMRLLLLYGTTRFAYSTAADLSIEAYRLTLYQPYEVHIARNSSDVLSGITHKVVGAVLGALHPLITAISSGILVVVITVTLIVIDPIVAIVASFGFGLSYGVVTWLFRRRLARNSNTISLEQTRVVKALREGLGGIRDVLLEGNQAIYCDIFRRSEFPLRRAYGDNIFVSDSPRFLMEAFGMTLIAGLALWLSLQPGGIAAALPSLAALALGAQRLLPALQLTFSSLSRIMGNQALLASTLDLLDQPIDPALEGPSPAPLGLKDSVRFDHVSFRYGADGPWVLRDFDLAIPKGARIGIVGSTGSGKSTALDILMGLLRPTEGALVVDGDEIIGARTRSWQRSIAHVPQHIYLSDASVAENIAFGVPRLDIDMDRVRRAARQAQIADFVESQAGGYDAPVGERGIRLSGGQRQRIGIARALYKQASVLVLDEATSALDNATERSVMASIEALGRELTIVIIAHRLSTVQHCNKIVEIGEGRVLHEGSYDELLATSPSFRQAVLANET